MQNYKVEVQNHSEAMEAQDLFLEIGFKKSTLLEYGYPKYVVADQVSLTDGKESGGAHISFVGTNYKKITLQELHAMVAPKQKEYLVKTDTGYVLQVLSNVVDGHDGIIEVPKDAMSYWECNKHNVKFFSKIEKGSHFYHYLNKNSEWVLWDDADLKAFEMKWQRESLNDQVASAEQARQEQTQTREISECDLIDSGKLIIGGFGESFPVGLEHHKFTQPEELPFIDDEASQSLNDQYAEIETVRQSAWAKQEGGSHDEISNPKHYTSGGIECIDAIEASMSHDAFCGFLKGNVQKYLWRYQYKGGLSSLNKAKWYIEKLIETEKCSKVQSLEG